MAWTSRSDFGSASRNPFPSERAVYYHRILGVPYGADSVRLKRAYHALARIYHPDVNPAGASRMRLINEAYQFLAK